MPNTINADNGVLSGITGIRTTADNTGNLALQSNGVTVLTLATNNTVTIAGTLTATGGVVVGASAAPAFSAYLSATQSFTANTFAKVQCNEEEFDTASCYDNTTNYRFTPTVAGYYQVTGMFTNATIGAGVATSIYKNGTVYKRLFSTNAISNVSSGGGTCLVYMNGSTDYIELWALTNTTQNAFANATGTYFQACLVRSA